MSGFLTVEDINGVNFRDGLNSYFHEIDTALISDTADFTDVNYDFVKVSRASRQNGYTYTFKVYNADWTGAYYFRYSDGRYIYNNGSYDSSTNTITYNSSHESVKLILYCSRLATTFNFKRVLYVPIGEFPNSLKLNEFGTFTRDILNLGTNSEATQIAVIDVDSPGVYSWAPSWSDYDATLYYLVRLEKTNFTFDCNQVLFKNKLNTVLLGVDAKYKPDGELVEEYTPIINVEWDGKVIPVTYDDILEDYVFELALRDSIEQEKVKFKVIVEENEVLNHCETEITLPCQYETITTFGDLKKAIDENNVVFIGEDISFSDTLDITRNIVLKSDSHKTLNVFNWGIRIVNGAEVKLENINLRGGTHRYVNEPLFTQEINTKLILNDCSITECVAKDRDNLGACIHCDVELDEYDDINITTEINNCYFTYNHSCIFHYGNLTIKDSTFEYPHINKNNPAFIYQVKGNAVIFNCSFDINAYTQSNIGFGQCVFMCGEDATINGQGHLELQNNNCSNVFKENRSSIHAEYYYPQIEARVETVSEQGYEEHSGCHAVSGVDWAFKNNCFVRRAD